MALRDQPYFPFFPDDFLSDEKLSLCSAESTGVYIRIMCLMHKSKQYGEILLKQKFKQRDKQTENFALMLLHQLPYTPDIIERSLDELIDEEVLILDGDNLIQKRMQKDGILSDIKAKAGSLGGKSTQNKYKNQNISAKAKMPSKNQANTVDDNEDKYSNESIDYECSNYRSRDEDKGVQGEKEKGDEPSGIGQVFKLYFDRINPNASSTCVELLKTYTADMGADVVCSAINTAIDNGALNWNYIKAILQGWTRQGVKCIEDAEKITAGRNSMASTAKARGQPYENEQQRKIREAKEKIKKEMEASYGDSTGNSAPDNRNIKKLSDGKT